MMKAIERYFYITRGPQFAFVVTLPLLLLYDVSYIFDFSIKNGVDFLSRILFAYTGTGGFLLVNGLLVLASVVAGWDLHKRGRLSLRLWGVVALEGMIYGWLMGKTVLMVMGKAHLLSISGMSVPMEILMSAGAGYHEELIFRLIPVGGAMWLLPKIYPDRSSRQYLWLGVVVIVESVLFSIAHFFGVEHFSVFAFWYRFFSGIFLSIIFMTRGFAAAAYAHFLYDVSVTVF